MKEATGFYEFIYEAIEARGLNVVLAHPLKLRALSTESEELFNNKEMLTELLRIDAVLASHVPWSQRASRAESLSLPSGGRSDLTQERERLNSLG